MANDSLQKYQEKRDFRRTSEPAAEGKEADDRPQFVVQKHDASSLHYDFRLTIGGVLKSWAVPKGPSTDPRQKRLAVPTEDHPLAYIDFEGVIPEGEYGAGAVLVWDRGPYRNLKAMPEGEEDESIPMEEAYANGEITVWLGGEKIRGGYALVRTNSGDDERWLLIKMDDDEADARRNPVSTEPKSVLSGRTIEEIAEEESEEGEESKEE